MKKIIFICAMMFVSVQAMDAAEKTASDKTAPEASKECIMEKAETPSVDSTEAAAHYRFLTSCGKSFDMTFDSNTSREVISDFMDSLENNFCPENQIS